jgi:hypothetical protein
LKSIVIPDGVQTLEAYSFSACSALTSIVLPDCMTSIGMWALSNCRSLADVKLPSQLKTIGENAFFYCLSLTNITLPDGLECLAAAAFDGTSIEQLILPASIREIDAWLFHPNDAITVIYYMGSAEDWARVCLKGRPNGSIPSLVACYSEQQPLGSGRFWHWVNGVPTLW